MTTSQWDGHCEEKERFILVAVWQVTLRKTVSMYVIGSWYEVSNLPYFCTVCFIWKSVFISTHCLLIDLLHVYKYYSKSIPVLNLAPRLLDVWGTPHILNTSDRRLCRPPNRPGRGAWRESNFSHSASSQSLDCQNYSWWRKCSMSLV
jgi:hypothetical protein